jgi:hypothetical protein
MNAKKAVYEILDAYNSGERFSGYELLRKVKIKGGGNHYPDTLLRYMRKYRKETGRIVVNVDKSKSIYEVI